MRKQLSGRQIFRKRWLLCLVAAAALWPATGSAQAKLGVAVFAPELPIDPLARFAYAKALATKLTAALGQPVQGFAFRSAGDFRAAQRRRKVHFAVIGGFYLSTSRVQQVLASGRIRGASQWTLMSKHGGSVLGLKGKTLMVPSVGGNTLRLLTNGLFQGNINVQKHFRVIRAPDLKSALIAVSMGKADAVFAPTSAAGLSKVFPRTLAVPPPAFVLLDRSAAAHARKAASAVMSFNQAAGPLAGYSAGSLGRYRRLAGLTGKRKLRMAMLATATPRLRASLVDASAVRDEYPSVADQYVVP